LLNSNTSLGAAADYLKPILIAAASTGMRKNELLGLRWKDIDFSRDFIRVEHSKNGEARNVPMSEFLKQTLLPLKAGRAQNDAVFTREEKRILCLKEAFKAAREKAGISDFRFHDLRHTAASLLAGGGCDIITLQNILGHKSLSMIQRYAHLIPERFEKSRQIVQAFWQGSASQTGDTKLTQSSGNGEGRLVAHWFY
jgi:integrase